MPKTETAIIGYAARLPGAEDIDQTWKVLEQGLCTIGDLPEDRWASGRFYDPVKSIPGKSYVRRAGTLEDPFLFDAAYFGVSPLEATQMDPQQRLLLEAVAHAFDHAGIDPGELDKERTGVYVGASAADHSTTALQDPALIEAHYVLGNTLSILANRISYQWDLRGPSLTVDTACSSSLIALDQARSAIAAGEIDTAIVAGVNLLLSPVPFVGFSRARMLSADGLCKAFALGADGYVRSEGVVVFVFRRASLARASGDRIRSVLVGSATNTDGRTSSMTLPSSVRQAELLECFLEKFELDPNDLAFLEAHGTGTAVGDPLEADAIGRAYGQKRNQPLPIGSSKSNFGHLEPVSGLVGLLKAQLSLEKNLLPASLHADELSPDIDFDGLNLVVARDLRPIPRRREPWCAAVNSFGFGGVNAHAVIRQPRREAATPEPRQDELPVLRITAASEGALKKLAHRWKDAAASGAPDLPLAVANANYRLARHKSRLCFPPGPAESLHANISDWLEGRPGGATATGHPVADRARVGFVFSGNGAVWEGMAQDLYRQDPVFRQSIERTSEVFESLGGEAVARILMTDGLGERFLRARVAQPLLFAIQTALVDALAHQGLRPHAVLGHSVGEVAAALAAGKISLRTAVHIVLSRSNALEPLHGQGSMAALVATEEDAEELISELGLSVEIAAINSRESVTLSGGEADLRRLLAAARKRRIAGKMLAIEYPYHSSALDQVKASLLAELPDVSGVESETDFYSGCFGRSCGGEELNTRYWWRNARDTVRFRDGVRSMAREGIGVFVEISPRSVLQSYMRDSLREDGRSCPVLGSLEKTRAREQDARSIALSALASGAMMQEDCLLGANLPFRAELPLYPFDRKRYELTTDTGLDIFGRGVQHPLLGGRVSSDSHVWRGELSLGRLPWLAQHRLADRAVFPATGILEMIVEAAAQIMSDDRIEIRDLEILRPVVLPENSSVPTRLTFEPAVDRVTLAVREGNSWSEIAFASIYRLAQGDPPRISIAADRTVDGLYTRLRKIGLNYGEAFAKVRSISVGEGTVDSIISDSGREGGFRIDPVSADAGMHAVAALLEERQIIGEDLFVPGRMGRVRVFSREKISGSRTRLLSADPDGVCVDVDYVSADGRVVASIGELRLRPMLRHSDGMTLLWDEIPVPVSVGVECAAAAAIARHSSEPGHDPDDLAVIRASIAGRLAWDSVSGRLDTPRGPETTADTAWAILAANDCVRRDDRGHPALIEPCPWPDIDTLLELLVQTTPQARAELRSTLTMLAPPQRWPEPDIGTLLVAAHSVLEDTRLSGARVLALGAVDAALAGRLAASAGYLTIAVPDEKSAEALALTLPQVPAVNIEMLDQARLADPYDLVLGVDVSRALSADRQAMIPGLLRPGGEVFLVEEQPDSFALITRRHGGSEAVESLARSLGQQGLDVEERRWRRASCVLLLSGRSNGRAPRVSPAFEVRGEGRLADGLRGLPAGEGPTVSLIVNEGSADLVETAIAQSRYFNNKSPRDGTTWVIQEGHVGAGTLRGWRRGIVNETGLDIRTMSVMNGTSPELVAELIATTKEHEIVLEKSGAFAPRIQPVRIPTRKVPEEAAKVLVRQRRNSRTRLGWDARKIRSPAAREVEIEVAATGLNFRDVMWAQGILPLEALESGFSGPTLGLECSGTVRRAGAESGFAPGDEVIALAPNAFGSHVIAPRDTVMKLPAETDRIAAAAIPVAFLTADYALNELARLSARETVLIHAAAGGVGLAAVQIARNANARVIATAGTPEKRRLLRALGVGNVLNSRTMEFPDQVSEITGGKGADVVLNSLGGEAMEKSLRCLAPFGRFLELGKRDFFANSALGMRALRNNVSYFGVDVDQLVRHRPGLAKRVMDRVKAGFNDTTLTPLPVHVFHGENVGEAFRLMQRSGHIGKIVVRPPKPDNVCAVPDTPVRGSWLIVGGTGGFGLKTAKWLADKGAGTVWLASRSGNLAESDAEELEAKGVGLRVRSCDVTREHEVERLLQEVAADGAGLSGVVHAAMMLDDSRFEALDEERIRKVIEPKLSGALILDRLTRRFSLDHFLLFGSVAGRFGSLDQSPYVAANLGMEEIAIRRRGEQLPALAIAWGPIGDTGYLSRHPATRDLIERRFGVLLDSGSALEALGGVLERDPERATITIAPTDWSKLGANFPVVAEPLFECLNIGNRPDSAETAIDVGQVVRELGELRARKAVLKVLVLETARIMRTAPSDVDPSRPLLELGFDSLMGMNLALAAEERLGSHLSAAAISDGLSLDRIAHQVVANAAPGGPKEVTADMESRHLTQGVPKELRDQILKRAVGM